MNNFNEIEILGDWIKNLIDKALNINDELDKSEFQDGLLQGYYESINHLITQLNAFGLINKLNDEYLKNFDPDDLLTGKAVSPFEKKES